MSIFVQQPHKRVRRLSGLGAFAALQPRVMTEGTGAFLDTDVCDFEALVQRIAAELGVRGDYIGKPALAMQDAAIYAHELYERWCPNVQAAVVNNYYENRAESAWGWWGPRRRRHHRGGGGHHGDWGHGGGSSGHDMFARPAPARTAPMRHAPMHAAPRPMHTAPVAHARVHATPARRMKGLGDIAPLTQQRAFRVPTQTVPSTAQPSSIQAIQERVTATLAPQMTVTDSPIDSPSSMPSLSLEGALPSGVAMLLGGALGLLGASMIFGRK